MSIIFVIWIKLFFENYKQKIKEKNLRDHRKSNFHHKIHKNIKRIKTSKANTLPGEGKIRPYTLIF